MQVLLDRDPSYQIGDQLPPAWHWLYFHDLVKASDLGSEGHPRLGLIMPPVPLPRRMWAGGSFEFHAPLRLGDTVEKTSVIRSITPKEGRSGPLYFVGVEHTLRTNGALNLVGGSLTAGTTPILADRCRTCSFRPGRRKTQFVQWSRSAPYCV